MKRSSTSRKSKANTDLARRVQDYPERALILDDDDAPEWTPEMFAKAIMRKGGVVIPRKKLLSLRIDEDVIAWFRAQGAGYQTQMNALLRAYMEATLARKK